MKREAGRYITGILALALLLGCLSGCAGDRATTMHLERFLGLVGVADEKAKALEPREGMQLYSGYEVGTAQKSQAWISLDEHKAVKLDEVSVGSIQQDGKQLRLTLREGKLFFHVSKPLEEDETFTIETATMVTGIRGTSGWVEVVDESTVRLALLEGTVVTQSTDPETEELREVTVTGGQILTVVYQGDRREEDTIGGMIADGTIDPEDVIREDTGLRLEELQEEKVPEFVAEEVAQSPELQEKIQEKSDLNVPQILGAAPSTQPSEKPTEVTEEPETSIPETEKPSAPGEKAAGEEQQPETESKPSDTEPKIDPIQGGEEKDPVMDEPVEEAPPVPPEPEGAPGVPDDAEAGDPPVLEDIPVVEAQPSATEPPEAIPEEAEPIPEDAPVNPGGGGGEADPNDALAGDTEAFENTSTPSAEPASPGTEWTPDVPDTADTNGA